MLSVIGFLVIGALFYFALARLTLPLWVNLVSSALLAMGLMVAIAAAKRRFLAAQRINRFLEQQPTKESLGDWLKQNGIDPDGKANDGDSTLVGTCLFFAALLLAFYLNPWSPTHPLEYVGLIITNVVAAATVSVIAYRLLRKILDLSTRKAVGAVLSSQHAACEEIVKAGNWQSELDFLAAKRRRDLDLGLWLVLAVSLGVLLDRFLPWPPAFYEAHRFVCAFISILFSGVVGLVAVAALHYTRVENAFEKKEILGIALACLIAPAIFAALGAVNQLSSEAATDVYGFEKTKDQRSGGFQTRSQRREKLVENLFSYVTSRHGLASLGTAAAVALPFVVGSLALLGSSTRSHLWKDEYQNYYFVGVVLGVLGLMIWISS